ncbi:hypothetical protein ACH5RR_025443 [Cinchona calisaya]|uniref:Uncharacterized protein n=1 Tax=Cinchona calisaya TaxID=153742 RepID=A0ABD2Z1K7_9GENT
MLLQTKYSYLYVRRLGTVNTPNPNKHFRFVSENVGKIIQSCCKLVPHLDQAAPLAMEEQVVSITRTAHHHRRTRAQSSRGATGHHHRAAGGASSSRSQRRT